MNEGGKCRGARLSPPMGRVFTIKQQGGGQRVIADPLIGISAVVKIREAAALAPLTTWRQCHLDAVWDKKKEKGTVSIK